MNVKIVGAPMDLGASRRGTDMGPSAMRVARLGPHLERLGHNVEDLGNIYSPTVETKIDGHQTNAWLTRFVELIEGWS